ncbi:semaphorin-4A [Gadus morhua]|uniref:Sema domain-containing protein n=1 Tax=Gadus morhua TaxID=8049 RepID=A0A8C5F9S5_GADMO|nr:semaphorin-4A-like [Gadus morhua]
MAQQGIAWLPMVLWAVLVPCSAWLTPRISFPEGSPGRPLVRFHRPDVGNTTLLLLSEDGDTLFVGARDAVISLDVSQEGAMGIRSQLDWSPSENDLQQCSMKGKEMMDCPNFIRVLQFLNTTHMYACGTYAFSPRCTYMLTENLTMTSQSSKPEEGRGRCPYDPYQRNTAITVDGELYTATVADYRGNRPVISRHLSPVDLKLDDTLGWLEDPTFVSSSFIPSEEKIYFFFSEVGREYDFIDKFIVSRVAQICTSDVGGQRTLQRRWTTFAKAQLLCQASSELPYNVVQDITDLPPPEGAPADDTLFYGIFTSQWSVNSGQSAVCAFRLGDIKATFSRNYKVLNRDTLRWSTRVQEKVANPGECGLHNASDNTLRFVKDNFLADDSVQPVGRSLTMVSHDKKYSHLAAQRVRAANHRDYTVLFLLTDSGYLHKAVLLEQGAHIVEEVRVFEQHQSTVGMQLSVSQGVVFVGTSEGVVRVPVANCSFYPSCAQCVLARDPLCGWDHLGRACVEVSASPASLGQDVDEGNVEQVCLTASLSPRSRFGLDQLTTGETVTVSVSLNEVVRLQCPGTSRHAQRTWERPDSRISPDLYLHPGDGSLRFVVTPATLGKYLCLSTENGHRQTLAVYHVRQKTAPPTPTPPARPRTTPTPAPPTWTATTPGGLNPASTTGVWSKISAEVRRHMEGVSAASAAPGTLRPTGPGAVTLGGRPRDPGLEDGERLPRARAPSYLKELVVVSVLLALCLGLLLTVALFAIRQRCRKRTAPQASDGRGGPGEREALRGEPSPRASGKRCNGHGAHGSQSNGQVGSAAPKGSNGHLPNTPICPPPPCGVTPVG